MSVPREELLASSQPLQKSDYEIEGSTNRMVDGDILTPEQFPELPPFTTRHVYRFIRDGRKASDDRLRALGGRQYAYVNLLPGKGHAIIVPERWTLEMFCEHFELTRPLRRPVSFMLPPSPITMAEPPSSGTTPLTVPPNVIFQPPVLPQPCPEITPSVPPPATLRVSKADNHGVLTTSEPPVTSQTPMAISSSASAHPVLSSSFLERARTHTDSPTADRNSGAGSFLRLIESQFAHIAETIGTIAHRQDEKAHRQDEKIFELGEGLQKLKKANVALSDHMQDVRTVVQSSHQEATALLDKLNANSDGLVDGLNAKMNNIQTQLMAAITGRSQEPPVSHHDPHVSVASTVTSSEFSPGNLSQALLRNRQRLMHPAPGVDGIAFGGIPDLGMLASHNQAMPIYIQNLPNAPCFTGTDHTTFSEWFKLFLRHSPNFNMLPEQQQWDQIAVCLRGSPQKLWISFESDATITLAQAIDKMGAMYDEKKNLVDQINVLYNTRKDSKQSIRDYVVNKIAFARDKFPAGVLTSVCGERMLEHAVLNGLPEEYRKTLYRYRTVGTVEELLDDVIQIEREAERTNQEQRLRSFQNNSSNRRASVESSPHIMSTQNKSKLTEDLQEMRRVFEEMDKPLKTGTSKGIKTVIIRGKRYTASGFRGLCQLMSRCFCCGGAHRAPDCKRRNNPIFPRPPGWVDRKNNHPAKEQVSATKATHYTQTKFAYKPRWKDDYDSNTSTDDSEDEWLNPPLAEINSGEVEEPENYLDSLAADGFLFSDPDLQPLIDEKEYSHEWEDVYDVGIASMEVIASSTSLRPPGEVPSKSEMPKTGENTKDDRCLNEVISAIVSVLPEKFPKEAMQLTTTTTGKLYENSEIESIPVRSENTVCTSPNPTEEGEWLTLGEMLLPGTGRNNESFIPGDYDARDHTLDNTHTEPHDVSPDKISLKEKPTDCVRKKIFLKGPKATVKLKGIHVYEQRSQ